MHNEAVVTEGLRRLRIVSWGVFGVAHCVRMSALVRMFWDFLEVGDVNSVSAEPRPQSSGAGAGPRTVGGTSALRSRLAARGSRAGTPGAHPSGAPLFRTRCAPTFIVLTPRPIFMPLHPLSGLPINCVINYWITVDCNLIQAILNVPLPELTFKDLPPPYRENDVGNSDQNRCDEVHNLVNYRPKLF